METIVTKPIPKTGERLPCIGLGTARVFYSRGNAADMDAKAAVVKALLAAGGTLIDTSSDYEDSEAIVGELVERLGIRNKTFIATKVEPDGPAAAAASMERSFKRLRTDKIDLMMVHNYAGDPQLIATLRDWKAQGRYRYIGVTHYQPRRQEFLAEVMAAEPMDFVQFNYSVDVREPENRLLPLAADKGIAVMANVPLGVGRLISVKQGQPVPAWLRELGCQSWAQVLLKFVVSHPAITVAIPATSSADHMADNMAAARGPMPDAKQRAQIAALWS